MLNIKSFSTLLMLATAAVAAPVVTKRSSAKKGLAYNSDAANVEVAKKFTAVTSWGYNWGLSSADGPTVDEFVPMCWGNGPHVSIQTCKDELPAIAQNAKHILGFNEPDHESQAFTGASQAVTDWMDVMQPYAGKVKLGAPAVTSTQGADGKGVDGWLQPFLEQCKGAGCTIDFVPIHYYNYSPDTTGKPFAEHCEHARDVVRKYYPDASIWVTEYGSFDASEENNAAWLKATTEYLEGADYVERYSAFGALVSDGNPTGGFMTQAGSGELNSVGTTYNS